MPGDPPDDDPYAPVPPPPSPPGAPRLPAPVTPGTRPPPLPAPGPRFAERSDEGFFPGLVDPVLEQGLGGLAPWSSRLHADPGLPWSVALALHADAPLRRTSGPHVAFLDERPMRVSVLRVPERSLQPTPGPVPLLSRLRTLRGRVLPDDVRYPLAAEWSELGGVPAVLDRLASRPGGPTSGFWLAAELSPSEGLVAAGFAPPDREDALTRVALPLASTARPGHRGVAWWAPPGWWCTEELQVTTDALRADVRLEPLGAGRGLGEWTDAVFGRAPFLRDVRRLAERPVAVAGLEAARLYRFDWQPIGRGRLLTTVVAGVGGGDGFSFVSEVPFHGDEAVVLADPEAVLASVEVRATPGPSAPSRAVGDERALP